MRGSQKAVSTLLLLVLPLHAIGAGQQAREPGTVTLLVENDAFAATDHHYTHGPEIAWLSAPRPPEAAAARIAEWLPTFIHRSREFHRQQEPDRFGSLAFTWRF